MENEYQEFVTFSVKAKDGRDVEMAVVDEFDFEKKHYVVASEVKEDEVDDTEVYIYESIPEGDDFTVKQISRQFDYNRIARAYMEMGEE